MNDSLENALAALGLSDSDSDDTITPMVEPSVQIGRSSRKHSNGRLSDEEDEHHYTPRPSERAHMYTASDSEEDSNPPASSTGYLRGETARCPTVRGGGLVVPRVAIILGQHSFRSLVQYIRVLVRGL
uniref:Uncharacterized protein n=1 Tax=Magallana gigas TaxID=29159 RepID=K1PSD5_MAGGI